MPEGPSAEGSAGTGATLINIGIVNDKLTHSDKSSSHSYGPIANHVCSFFWCFFFLQTIYQIYILCAKSLFWSEMPRTRLQTPTCSIPRPAGLYFFCQRKSFKCIHALYENLFSFVVVPAYALRPNGTDIFTILSKFNIDILICPAHYYPIGLARSYRPKPEVAP